MRTDLLQLIQNQAAYTTQKEQLIAEGLKLDGDLKQVNVSAQTYNQEFLDRLESPPPQPFLGLRSTQDWALAGFYFAYAVASLIFIVLVTYASTKKLFALLGTILITFLFGTMITFVLIQVA